MRITTGNFKAILATLTIIFSVSALSAGPATLKVSMDSAYLLMGKATPIHIQLVTESDTHGNLMIPSDSMCACVEILKPLRADTTELGNNRTELNGQIMIQAFDSGTYLLKPILFIDGGETISSSRLALKVLPAMVDSLTTIHDYADVKDVKRKFVDYLPDFIVDYGIWILAVLLLLTGAWFATKRFLKKPEQIQDAKVATVPPYEEAVGALSALRQQNLCEQGREKEYYTILTDILRNYLYRRFGINAMEMTSSQIRSILNQNDDTRPSKRYVDQVLEIADFVKFAKMRPLPDDNVKAFNSAMQFVEDTKPAPKPAETADSDENETDKPEVKPKN